MKTIIAVLGDFYHRAEWSQRALEQAITPYKEQMAVRYVSHTELADALAGRPDAVIMYKADKLNPQDPANDKWMTDDIAEAITRYVENGGSWLAWHSGMSSYRVDGEYIRMLRGHFIHHPKQTDVTYETIASALASASGSTPQSDGLLSQYASPTPPSIDFQIFDEHYFVACDEENTNVFLRSFSRDGKSVAGWSHRFGEGKVCCLTPAHNEEGMLDERMQQQLVNCIMWCIS